MTSPKVGLFANKDSKQLLVLRDILLEEGATPHVFDVQLGGDASPRVTLAEGRYCWEDHDFSDIDVIHIRCLATNMPVAIPPVLNAVSHSEWRTCYLREQEYQSVIAAFFSQLEAANKLVVNLPTGGYLDHDSKAQLYQKLRAWGFSAPKTLMTNDPDQALRFLNQMGALVVKPSVGVGSTRMLAETDRERLEELRVCPTLLQEFFAGDTIRVHIVGDSVVLALRILADRSTEVDSRVGTKGFEYFKLPDEEEAMIVRATRALGLHYAAWDILATDDGRFVYLDCNPGPYIMWIGEENTRFVLRQLARYMIAYTRNHSIAEASGEVRSWRPQ
jgi:hypothetical protein